MTKTIERERSTAGLSVDEAHRDGITMGDPRDPNAKMEQERIRIPLNSGQKQSLRGYKLDTKAYHYKWVHEPKDRPGKLLDYINAFYEHCVDEQGHHIVTAAGSGTDYLMRLPMKYHLEDIRESKAKREALRKRQTTIKGEYAPSTDGRRDGVGGESISRSVSDNPIRGGRNENPYA